MTEIAIVHLRGDVYRTKHRAQTLLFITSKTYMHVFFLKLESSYGSLSDYRQKIPREIPYMLYKKHDMLYWD